MQKSDTVFNWVYRAAQVLKDAGFKNTLFEARFLAAMSLNQSLSWVLSHPHSFIEQPKADNYLLRRLNHEPLAYIAGKREFWGREFIVDSRVLIPRQETEEIIETCLDIMPLDSNSYVLDLCTGSGCIGITLKIERPFLNMEASDLSSEALKVAQENALKQNVSIQWHQGDLFDFGPKNCFDFIVCNPPYISNTETLEKEVFCFEPSCALWASEGGLVFYKRLSEEAIKNISPKGKLILEVGYNQSSIVKKIFQSKKWIFFCSKRDLCGIERCLVFQRPR